MLVFFHQNPHASQQQQPKPMIMSTIAASPSPPHPNPHARLELLSNTAILKKVMDSKVTNWAERFQQMRSSDKIAEPKKSTASGTLLATEPAVQLFVSTNKVSSSNPSASSAQQKKTDQVTRAPKTMVNQPETPMVQLSEPEVEKSSLSTPTTVSPAPPSEEASAFTIPASSSYASLLLPPAAEPSAMALTHQQLFALAAHNSPHLKTAMAAAAFRRTATSEGSRTTYAGGPSSAFRKPHRKMVILKETLPPAVSHDDSRQTSPTQSFGEMTSRESVSPPSAAVYQALLEENQRLQKQLKQKEDTIASLKTKADGLEKQIGELRQLPTGKISHIPIEDMIRIMQDFGSEVSNQTLPKRKQPIQKASIVRQFRRWNPEFFRFFVHVNGEWVPRLGREGELKRRVEKRSSLLKNKRAGSPDSAQSH